MGTDASYSDEVKRTRLKPISDKRKAQLREYREVRRNFIKSNPVCEVCQRRRTWDIHHKAGRVGKRLLDQFYWLAVCRPCHDRIHDEPRWARETGFLIR